MKPKARRNFQPIRVRYSVVATSLAIVACSVRPEYSLLQQFFSASRLRDTTALQSIATVVFEPREQGVVTDFTIRSVTPRRDGIRQLKDVTISAPVRTFAGDTVQKTLIVTLQQVEGRWLVTQIR